MDHQLRIEGSFGFSNVQLVKSEENSLGMGSYGAVYKAKCDQLVCAAKVLHQILAGHRILERFQLEIRFLSNLRHPNVIQYLGSCAHREFGPVLFMELMDESLTSFLERRAIPLPLHMQVDIGHDVAQALSYLHRHEVLHRDLSSNNVLLIGSRRAKVTDFGMARFLDTNPNLTQVPGTPVYMSPEALAEPPTYTAKLDIFSCGVLLVQILTSRFPDPGPRTRSAQIGSGEVLVVKPERERRKNHLDLISPSHPLLKVALNSLKDRESQRPTADELCSRLIALRDSPPYVESTKNELSSNSRDVGGSGESISFQQEVAQLQSQNEELVQQSIHKDALLLEREGELEEMNGKLQEAEAVTEQLREQNASLQRELEDMRKENQRTGSLKLQWRKGLRAPVTISGQSVAVSKGKVYFCDSTSQAKIAMYDSTTEQWSILPECPDGRKSFSIAVVDGFLTAIGGKHEKATKKPLSLSHDESGASRPIWGEQFPKMKYYHLHPAVVSTNVSLIVAGGGGPDEVKGPVEVMNIPNRQWSKLAGLPFVCTRATAAIYDGNVYVGGGYKDPGLASKSVLKVELTRLLQSHPESAASSLAKKVFGSDDRQSPWKEVTNMPLQRSSLVTFHHKLLAVGGGRADIDADATAEVREYDHRTNSWNPVSRMRVQRSGCFASVLPGDRLMVYGGDTPDGQTDSTEIASIAK